MQHSPSRSHRYSIVPAILFSAFGACLASCAGPAEATDTATPDSVESPETFDASVLFEADRDFARVTSERRVEGWMSYFDDRSAKVPVSGDFVQGLEAIRRTIAPTLADPSVELFWEPEVGAMIEAGQLGFTRGRYKLVRIGDDGSERTMSSGTYLTVWRRTPDGWRVALDTGIPD